ncbi:MAG: hypothetical protein AAFX87_05285 [Bacteroidota bacterium]
MVISKSVKKCQKLKINSIMNNLSVNIKSFFAVLLAATLISVNSFAVAPSDKAVEKARKAVANASPDDWETFAKSAQMCIRKNVNMAEAQEWLEKSIAIKATSFNLEVMGDYFMKNKLPVKAMEYYVKSIDKAKRTNVNADTGDLQTKINQAKAMRKKIG